jgi:hypothetical protein
MSHQ